MEFLDVFFSELFTLAGFIFVPLLRKCSVLFAPAADRACSPRIARTSQRQRPYFVTDYDSSAPDLGMGKLDLCDLCICINNISALRHQSDNKTVACISDTG